MECILGIDIRPRIDTLRSARRYMCMYCCTVGIDIKPRIDTLRSTRRYMGEALRCGVVPYSICGASRSFANKSPISTAKEPYLYGKRDLAAQQKSPTCTTKETYLHSKRALRRGGATLLYLRSSLILCPKEPYFHGKRGLFEQQKRPSWTEKETYLHSKRDLLA